MNDSQVSTSKLVTAALWGWVLVVLAAAWVAWYVGPHDVAVMFGFTACASSAVAATSSVRCYSLRVCGMLRAVHGLDNPNPPEVRPLR